MAEIGKVRQFDRLALFGAQTIESRANVGPALKFGTLVLRAGPGGVDLTGSLERLARGLAPSRSEDVDRATARQCQQPCARTSTPGIEAGSVPPGLGVHFDHRIFRGVAVPKNAHGEPEDPRAAGVVQLGHRRLVSASRPLYEPVPGFLAGWWRRRWSILWHAAKS